jgi:ribosomal protein L19E
MVSLAFQRRLAMSLFHCGWRKVWLDPSKKHIIAQARTREAVRDLIAQDIIQFVPTNRGKFNAKTKMLQNQNPILKRIKAQYAQKLERNQPVFQAELLEHTTKPPSTK